MEPVDRDNRRLPELAARLAEKQQEINRLRAGTSVHPVFSSRGWRYFSALSLVYRLIRFDPEARRLLAMALRRRLPLLWSRRTPAALAKRSDNVSLYAGWREANEPDASQLAAQRRIAARRPQKPLISVLTPVFQPSPDAIADCIASVRAQSWDHWEHVLVLAGPQPPGVRQAAEAAAREDTRVRLLELPRNGGIAANTNAGLSVARGEFVCLLDHDDQLSPDALFETLRQIDLSPETDVVSFDEDKLTGDGRTRLDPFFKPCAPSPEHLLAINCRMRAIIRKASIDAIGGVRSEVDGAQDWDLALRLCEHGVRARHLPRVLYHWRMVPGSAACDASAKPWAFKAQLDALRGHLTRQGLAGASAEHTQVGVVRVSWRPATGRRASVIIPTKDRAALLEACIRSVREKTRYENYEILIVDTGSVEEETRTLYERLGRDPSIRFLRDDRQPFNYSRANNLGAREARGDVLIFLNNDIEVVSPDWMEELVRWAERPEIGCVGPKLVYPDGTLQHAGIIMGMGGHGSHVYQGGPADHDWGVFGSVDFYRNYLALGGACLAVGRKLFESLGGFDEAYELCYSDIDLCLRSVGAGRRNVYTPFARLLHHEGATRGLHFPPHDVLRASLSMYALVVHGDPFYSRNLSSRERLPTICASDDPSARGALIAQITRLFAVEAQWQDSMLKERLGSTAHWKAYEPLVRSLLPPPSAFEGAATCGEGGLRLLFVIPELSRSGGPMACLQLARFLCARGHFVCVLAPREGRLREDLEEVGARVVVNPMALEASYVFGEIFASFDAVLPNGVRAWPAVLAANAVRRPTVWLIHEAKAGLELCRTEAGAVQALALADDVVFPSLLTRRLFGEFDAGNMSAELYGLDVPDAVAETRTLDRLRCVAVGKIEPRKGQDVFIAAIRALPRPLRDSVEARLIGPVLDEAFANRFLHETPSVDVEIRGERPWAEALADMGAADIVVCPSHDEAGPFAVLEAMALGKAIISTPVGAIPELLDHEQNALIVSSGHVTQLSEALKRLADDRGLRQRLGRAARERFRETLTGARYGEAVLRRVRRATETGKLGG